MTGRRYLSPAAFAVALSERTGIPVRADWVREQLRRGRIAGIRFTRNGSWHVRSSELERLTREEEQHDMAQR